MEDRISKDAQSNPIIMKERQERCTLCVNLNHVDGYCNKHGEDCWLIKECNDYEPE